MIVSDELRLIRPFEIIDAYNLKNVTVNIQINLILTFAIFFACIGKIKKPCNARL
jgi:hypothetical protein